MPTGVQLYVQQPNTITISKLIQSWSALLIWNTIPMSASHNFPFDSANGFLLSIIALKVEL